MRGKFFKVGTVLLFVICGTLVAGASPNNDSRDVEVILLHLERLKFDAQQRKDTAAFGTMLDDALLWVEPNGALRTKAAYLAGLHDPTRQLQRISPESMTVKVFAAVAIVVGIYDDKGVKVGRAYHQRCRFIDTWAFKKGEWVCIPATATPAIS